VFDGLIGTVAHELIWKLSGDARIGFVIAASWLGEQSPSKAYSGLDHTWSEGARHQCPDEAPGGAEWTVAMEQRFCYVFTFASYL